MYSDPPSIQTQPIQTAESPAMMPQVLRPKYLPNPFQSRFTARNTAIDSGGIRSPTGPFVKRARNIHTGSITESDLRAPSPEYIR